MKSWLSSLIKEHQFIFLIGIIIFWVIIWVSFSLIPNINSIRKCEEQLKICEYNPIAFPNCHRILETQCYFHY